MKVGAIGLLYVLEEVAQAQNSRFADFWDIFGTEKWRVSEEMSR